MRNYNEVRTMSFPLLCQSSTRYIAHLSSLFAVLQKFVFSLLIRNEVKLGFSIQTIQCLYNHSFSSRSKKKNKLRDRKMTDCCIFYNRLTSFFKKIFKCNAYTFE